MKKLDLNIIRKNPSQYDGKVITVGGWARSVRDMKTFGFMDLNDGTSFKGLQVVLGSEKLANYAEVAKLNSGSSVLVKGTFKLTPEAKQPYELEADEVEIISATDSTYPLQKKGHTMEFLREHAYLRPRTNLFNAVFRVRSEAQFALHQFFNSQGFVNVQAPILTASDCEGAGELFRVSTQDIYSGKKLDPKDELLGKAVYLSPSCQLEGEAFAITQDTIKTCFPGIGILPYVVTGGTDARFYDEVADSCVRFSPVNYGPEQMAGMHGLNENIEAGCLPGAVDYYKEIIKAQARR